ncbi:hypothetical protein EPR50_G00178570 [Xyrichtys novacula]|uniref:Uncharacterized protein n=1 Tax=Xyrichtys novacula TaxID=13765 RepID=A0AAV1G159_XYRNO|nr:hypothetical protein EPR50_G00178570 [Xyrichtys novacula]
MRREIENQGKTRPLADNTPRNKVNALPSQFKSFVQESPMKPSQVPNRLPHPAPRTMLPPQTHHYPDQRHKQTPPSEKLIPGNNPMVDLNRNLKRRRESEDSNHSVVKLHRQGENSWKVQTPKPPVGNSLSASLVSQPSLRQSLGVEQTPKPTDCSHRKEAVCGVQNSPEPSPKLKGTPPPCASPTLELCLQKQPAMGAKQAYVEHTQNDTLRLMVLSSSPKQEEESLKKKREVSDKTDKPSTLFSLKDNCSSPSSHSESHHSAETHRSKSVSSKCKQGEENRKSANFTPKQTSKPSPDSKSCCAVKRSKSGPSRRRVSVTDNIDDLFTPDPMTYVVSPAHKTLKPKIEGGVNRSSTSEKNGSSSTVTSSAAGSSDGKTQNDTITCSPHAVDTNISLPSPDQEHQNLSGPFLMLNRLKPDGLSLPQCKDVKLKNGHTLSLSSHRKDKTLKSNEKHKSPPSNTVRARTLETDSAASGQSHKSLCTQPAPVKRQASTDGIRQLNQVDPTDVELDLDLSLALDLDLTQSSHSSDDEQLLSLQEMMAQATRPPDTPEKGAFSEPGTPAQRSCRLRTHLPPTTKSGNYKNSLDQMLKEIDTNRKLKEIETQLLTACQEDLLRMAEYEETEENQDDGISTEHQEFLQRFSLMSCAFREVPPGEVVFNLEKFGQIFSHDTLQLRHCMLNPVGAAQKTLLWSSPAQLRLHINIGLFHEAYGCHSPCPTQVTRFLFKMMSVHNERMLSQNLLQTLCDIASTAAYQIVKNKRQEFEVWVPSLADVALVLMNMGASFVTLFPFEHLQPPFTEGDLLEDIPIKTESSPRDEEQSIFPEHNCINILKYLSYCMGLCPRAYSDDELLLMLTVVGKVGLDQRLILQSPLEMYPLLYKVVNNFRDWNVMLPRVCSALTDLTDDHHNMCLLIQMLPDNTRGKQLRRHLSLSMISKLLDGHCTYTPTDSEIQLSELRRFLPRMPPSTLLRQMLKSQRDKEDMAMLDQQSYYLCYSLLTLVKEASNFQFFPAHQKEQLLILSSELEMHVKCDIRESEKCLYRSKVKDLVARIYTKWQMLLQKTKPLNGKLYDYWQPLSVDTLKSSQEDQEAKNDEREEAEEKEASGAEENEEEMMAEEDEKDEGDDVMDEPNKTEDTERCFHNKGKLETGAHTEAMKEECTEARTENNVESGGSSQIVINFVELFFSSHAQKRKPVNDVNTLFCSRPQAFKMSEFQEGITNGPSRGKLFQNDAQIWERPWTLEEMRQSSANWSLAADSGLFLFLQDFSQRMLSKTHEIEKQMDSLIRDTKATDSCLHSVFNDFLMLSNTQFIENRVYDEEVEETISKAEAFEKQPEQEKTREQKEAELIPKMQEAVNYGLSVLESAFEHLDIKAGNSDSEDDDLTDRVEAILEPKDLYVDRPLPYLIGSQAFMEQEDVGLGDLSSDEMSVDSDRDSVIESDEGKEADHSDDDFIQEEDEDHSNLKKKTSMLSYDDDEEEEDEDSDIFGESDRDDDEDSKNTGPSSFADELAARIKGEPIKKPEGDRASITSKKKTKGRKETKAVKPQAAEEDSDDIFKPPKMDEDDLSPFGGKSGLFSGGKGLFDDDDEGDLFSEAPKPPVSEEKKALNESFKTPAQPPESDKPAKKIPAGAVAIFPDNNLFSSENDSDPVENKENGAVPKQAPTAAGVAGGGGGGGGLFDDEEDEDDDFFSGKSLKKPEPAVQEKPKAKKTVDLFDEDDEDGDIFSEKNSAPAPAQNKKEVVEEQVKHPEKKLPVGAISMFGPGTKSLLIEGLKKRQQSTSEESEKSEENGVAPDAGKAAVKPTPKPQSRSLFSDDEDTPAFPTIPKSQSKPEPTSQNKSSKAPLSLFDDEEDEDLFASAAKSKPKPTQAKASAPQPSKAVSGSLFSDDEDQWISSKSSPEKKPEVKTGGMKPSVSAPSSLPSAKTSHKSSLFDDDDDDLFAPTKETSQKKPQRVALLFEDEGDEDKGSLFDIKPTVNTNTAAPASKTPVAAPQSSSVTEKSEEVSVSTTDDKPPEQVKPSAPELPPSSSPLLQSSDGKKKPAGAVSLFGGIDIFASKQTKSPLDESDQDDGFLTKESPPAAVKKEEKKEEKVKTVSLFDDDEVDDSDWNDSIFTPSKPTTKNTLKSTEERTQTKSTGVFQDEELLFSQTQQKDNDPDVDLFATSGKASSSKLSSTKPAAQSLFADDDEDDLFGSIKPKAPPPKVAEKPSKPNDRAPLASPESVAEIKKPAPSVVKPKDSSSRIGKLQANLMINPAALLPGAVPTFPGASPGTGPSSSSGVSSSSLSPSPVTTPVGAPAGIEGAVSFDTPVLVSTLQSAHKSRAKGSAQRRPQSRARQGSTQPRDLRWMKSRLGVKIPSALTLPVSTISDKTDSSKGSSSTNVLPPTDEDDLFGSDSLFGVTNSSSSRRTTETTAPPASNDVGLKKDKDKSTLPSIFDDNTDDLFQNIKPKSTTKKTKASSFLGEDDDEDIFGVSNSSTPTSTNSKEIKNSSTFSKQDIFQDEVTVVPKVDKKHKEKTIDASLFDDNIDIFADLTDSLRPKQKSKTKGETKSIFDDDMDDIFSPSVVKAVTKAPSKSKKTPSPQEIITAADSSDIFDDPLNALGGN